MCEIERRDDGPLRFGARNRGGAGDDFVIGVRDKDEDAFTEHYFSPVKGFAKLR